jgi:hypothetical protein
MMRLVSWLLVGTLAGCARAPLATPQPAAKLAAAAAPSSVRALRKAIKDQLEVRDDIHAVTAGDVDVVPSVIWNIFNFETTTTEEVFGLGKATYHVVGTYDVLTKDVTVVDQDLTSSTSLAVKPAL